MQFIVPDMLVETMHFQCKALVSPFRLFIPATLEQVREPGTFSPLSAITYGLLVFSGSVVRLGRDSH